MDTGRKFSTWDYVVFIVTLAIALAIGVYQALAGRRQFSSKEFLLAGRQLSALPVAMSLTASFMSGITVIGTPAEAYQFGAPFLLFAFSYSIMSTISAEIFVPLFYRLGITSTYEYLERRFNRLTRIIGTSMYIGQTVLYTGMVIYAPALALNLVTGLDLWGVLVATGVVCTIYCTVGGLKAVIWTDVFQMIIMLSGFLAIIIRGAVVQGGVQRIWNDSYYGGRLNIWDFDPDPLKRHTFWTVVVGGSLMWTSIYAINQSQVQRYISCRSQLHAKMSLYFNMVGLWITVTLAMVTGFTMYSIYSQCDPLSVGKVSAPDQLLPYLVMDILADYPGVPGLFVAAAYSGTLSTVSSSINALTAVTVEDFIKPLYPTVTERRLAWVSNGLSIFYGAVCIAMAAMSSLMGNILQAALSIFGMISGPLLGLYLLGMFFPCANSIGGLVGLFTGLILTLWVGIGAQIYPPLPEKTNPLHLSTAGCVFNYTEPPTHSTALPWSSDITATMGSLDQHRPGIADTWYSLSYLYFCPVGTLTALLLGLIVSLLTGGRKQKHISPDLFIRKSDLLCFTCKTQDEEINKEITNSTPDMELKKGTDNPSFDVKEENPQEKMENKTTL
ncbi:sodium-coupled monocarboxylate transporter 1 [Polypterus senegalus]|uniref:sodium-coupled monocarboxylate transporter 1 n=1 Tax=Polypterus senegalus TaxID=55291 RepID=UPI0019665840|nr:sodium-coupled monocarboxylate transporter 1 [Polypterus senegalus]